MNYLNLLTVGGIIILSRFVNKTGQIIIAVALILLGLFPLLK